MLICCLDFPLPNLGISLFNFMSTAGVKNLPVSVSTMHTLHFLAVSELWIVLLRGWFLSTEHYLNLDCSTGHQGISIRHRREVIILGKVDGDIFLGLPLYGLQRIYTVKLLINQRAMSDSATYVGCVEAGPNATTPWDWRRSALFAAFGAGYQGGSQFIIFNRILVRYHAML